MIISEEKSKIRNRLEKECTVEEREQAKGDFHAWRDKCVSILPILSGKDCPFACTYCYIQSMGSAFKDPEPLNLTGPQICYALLENKEFIPGPYGTTLAFGQVSEPFLPQLKQNTLDYFKAIAHFLNNPIQFSSKMYLDPNTVKEIKARIKPKYLNPLITITTIEHAAKLEPHAPTPKKRFESISNLTEAGYKVFLYFRPLIPGVVDYEIEELLIQAQKAGAVGVVTGGLRITLPILNAMKKAGINISEIAQRSPKIDKKQSYIYTKDLEDKVIRSAKAKKLIALHSTKCAMAYTAKVPCASLYWTYNPDMCTRCKNCWDELPKFTQQELEQNIRGVITPEIITSIKRNKDEIEIKVKSAEPNVLPPGLIEPWKPRLLETLFRQRVTIRK
jgi:DNA repair photolyase